MDFDAFIKHEENLEEEDFEKGDDLIIWEGDRDYAEFCGKKYMLLKMEILRLLNEKHFIVKWEFI